jgi:hypothetical protein
LAPNVVALNARHPLIRDNPYTRNRPFAAL